MAKWTPKEERQYEHIKESAKKRGKKLDRANEIAARTVNKGRAQRGETSKGRSSKSNTNKGRSSSSGGRSRGKKS